MNVTTRGVCSDATPVTVCSKRGDHSTAIGLRDIETRFTPTFTLVITIEVLITKPLEKIDGYGTQGLAIGRGFKPGIHHFHYVVKLGFLSPNSFLLDK
jgi:hypothetical protein